MTVTRKLPHPTLDEHGNWHGQSMTSPEHCKIRGALAIPSSKVIPIIFIPGVMGSNLKATKLNKGLKPGEQAWRPPNSAYAGVKQAGKWREVRPKNRQNILDPEGVEVDDSGPIHIPMDWLINMSQASKERGWGTVHWGSYGDFLFKLQMTLNQTFARMGERRIVQAHWQEIMSANREQWDGKDLPDLSEADLLKYAKYQYPVYALGYNWLASSKHSAAKAQKRIEEIIAWWQARKHQCDYVIIVTHSMGGLVGRAVAKAIPDKVLGVIHGVMPAVGAPICYRRIACGTEVTSPSNGWKGNLEAGFLADIVGRTAAETMPVMGNSPGALELLPTHRYPEPWLKLGQLGPDQKLHEIARLPEGDPYEMYRDFNSWYRLLDPALCDPAARYKDAEGGVETQLSRAINQAEHFHKQVIDEYYHPNTYAFYGEDKDYLTYGSIRWAMRNRSGEVLTAQQFKSATLMDIPSGESRQVKLEGHGKGDQQYRFFDLLSQDAKSDGTVSPRSGAAPKGKPGVKRVFKTKGYDHQGSYMDKHMVQLTQYLIAKMVAEKAGQC